MDTRIIRKAIKKKIRETMMEDDRWAFKRRKAIQTECEGHSKGELMKRRKKSKEKGLFDGRHSRMKPVKKAMFQ